MICIEKYTFSKLIIMLRTFLVIFIKFYIMNVKSDSYIKVLDLSDNLQNKRMNMKM